MNELYFSKNIKLNLDFVHELRERLDVIITDEQISKIQEIIFSESKIIEKEDEK